jgi:hypothetical protein
MWFRAVVEGDAVGQQIEARIDADARRLDSTAVAKKQPVLQPSSA